MKNKIVKYVFIGLFAALYLSVAIVSTYHAIAFFGLANLNWVSVMLAITFELGQAAVLFSILTKAPGKSKVLPWILMCVLTLVQVMGNVYSSYHYLITNSTEMLRYFKEPIFIWTELPDAHCNVLLTYIIGAILPIVSLLMTGMVTNYLGLEQTQNENNVENTKQEEQPTEEVPVNDEVPDEIVEQIIEPTNKILDNIIDETETNKKSGFINI